VTGRNLIAYAIIAIGVALLVLAVVRSRRRPAPRQERIRITQDDPQG
jgi:hypothetical protein